MIGPGDSAPKLSAQTAPKPARGGDAAGPDRRAAPETGDESAAARTGTGGKGEAGRDGFAALVSDAKPARADKASPSAERGAKPSGRQAAAEGALFTGEPQTGAGAAPAEETTTGETAAKATATKAPGEDAAAEGGERLEQSGDPLASETPDDGAKSNKANAASPAPQEQAATAGPHEAPTAERSQPAEAPPPDRPSAQTAAPSEASRPQAAHDPAAPAVEPVRAQAQDEPRRARQAREEAAPPPPPAAESGKTPEPRAAPLAATAEASRPALPGAPPALATDEGLSAALPGAETARREIAAPPTPAPAPTDPGRAQAAEAARVIGQITVATSRTASDQVQVRLDPPELGRVSLHFTMTDDGVSALVTADRAETVDLLRRNAEMLQRDLSGAGYRNVTLDFGGGGETGQRGPGDGDRGRQADAFDAGDEIVSTYRRATLPGHLDIRF